MMRVFIGTQGDAPGQGIWTAAFDPATGALTTLVLAAEVARPTWLLVDPARPVLHAVSELGNAGDREGEVFSFAIGDEGALTPLACVSPGGGGPTHLTLTADGQALLVANFGGGSLSVLPLDAQGRVGARPAVHAHIGSGPHRRQTKPHPHGVTLDPEGGHVHVPDMGADRIFTYAMHGEALMPAGEVMLPAGSGPRTLLYGPDGRHAWLLSELSAEIFVFQAVPGGALALAGTFALDDALQGAARSAAAFVIAADGRRLYASNRRTQRIHVLAIDPDDGHLAEVETIDAGGTKPWAATLSPDGGWLLVANQGSDTIAVFRVAPDSGRLTPVGAPITVPQPTCIAFSG